MSSEKLHLLVSITLKHNTDSHFPTASALRVFHSLLRNMKVRAFRFPDLPLRTIGKSDNSLIIYVSSQDCLMKPRDDYGHVLELWGKKERDLLHGFI